MSKKTFSLIIFLFLVTCGLLYLAVMTPGYKKKEMAPTPTPLSVNAHTTLSLVSANPTGYLQPTHQTLSVVIDTGDNSVTGVQIELAYDPQALTNVTVSPGTFFQQPNTLINNVNTVDGRISYAVAEQVSLPGKKGSGQVAFISFDIAPTFTGKTTNITFLPKTAVAADKILESVLKQTNNYVITLPQTIQNTTPTPFPTR